MDRVNSFRWWLASKLTGIAPEVLRWVRTGTQYHNASVALERAVQRARTQIGEGVGQMPSDAKQAEPVGHGGKVRAAHCPTCGAKPGDPISLLREPCDDEWHTIYLRRER